MPATFFYGVPKRCFDIRLAACLVRKAIRRFGFIEAIRELRQYFKDERSYFRGSPNRYVKQGKEIYVVPNLPPLNQAEFLDCFLSDIDVLNHSQKLPLAFAMVSVSARCPYYCGYCYTVREKRQHEVVPIPILVRAIRGLMECGVRNIFFTGGEPMMRWDELPGLLDACCDGRTGFWIISTGWKMDEKKLEVLCSHGLRGVIISLDSMEESECVRSKGHPDAFVNATRAIRSARRVGLIPGVNCVMSRELLDPLKFKAFITFIGELGARYINCFSPRPVKEAKEHSLTSFTIPELKKLLGLIQENQQSREYNNLPVAYSPEVWEARRGCVGGQVFLYISPNGNVTPCPFIDKASGNILKDDIREVVKTIRAQVSSEGCEVNKLIRSIY